MRDSYMDEQSGADEHRHGENRRDAETLRTDLLESADFRKFRHFTKTGPFLSITQLGIRRRFTGWSAAPARLLYRANGHDAASVFHVTPYGKRVLLACRLRASRFISCFRVDMRVFLRMSIRFSCQLRLQTPGKALLQDAAKNPD